MNEDPNDPRKPIGGLGGKDVGPWNSPGGDATIASTVQTGDGQNDDEDHVEVNEIVSMEQQREMLQRQMIQWGIASGTSITAVTVAFVPLQVIVAFFILVSVFMGFSFSVFQRLRLEAMDLRRRGIAGYLPEGIVDTLINRSFHDQVVNSPNFWEDNGYFLLYFIPGLSEEQINSYVNRLVPEHQQVLRRPGLGHFIGPSFMRLLLGDEQYTRRVQPLPQVPEGRPVPRRLELAPAEVASHLDEDDMATIEEVEEEEDQHAEIPQANRGTGSDFSRFWGTPQPIGRVFSWNEDPATGSSSSGPERSANIPLQPRDLASAIIPDGGEEGNSSSIDVEVLREAILGGIDSITTGVRDAVGDMAIGFFTGTPLRTGISVTAATVGIGYFSMWLGGGASSERMRMPRTSMPSNPVMYSSFLASGATAGIMYFFQVGRSAGGPGRNPGSGGGSTGGP